MAHSPHMQHCSPVHGCGRPSIPCTSAAAEPGKITGHGCSGSTAAPGWVAGTTTGWAASWAQRCSLRPCHCAWALPCPSATTRVQELLCGSTRALGQPREQALSKWPQNGRQPLADCWRSAELLGQSISARGEPAGPPA